MLKIAFESSSYMYQLPGTHCPREGDLQRLPSTATSQMVTSSKRKESVGKKQYFFDAILLHTNNHTLNSASLNTVRLKQQGTVYLLSIHSHFTQDSTISFSDLSWPSCTCLFEYEQLLVAFSFCSCGIFLLIVTHTSKTCCHVLPPPYPCYSSFLHLSSPSLFPTASHEELTRDTVSSVAVWVAGASTSPTK